ncbi:MAG: hypothetical protein GY940_12490 [bacterium]|nr:hypothetical protein [bacterium]
MKKLLLLVLVVLLTIACGGSKEGEKESGASPEAVKIEKFKLAMNNMKMIGTALESYMTDEYKVPEVDDIEALKKALEPLHIKTMVTKDPWGNPFVYQRDPANKEEYAIWCTGTDGKLVKGSNDDVLFTNGNFVLVPKLQTQGPPASKAGGDEKGNYTDAMGTLKSIGTALESYQTDNYDNPNVATITELKATLEPFHIKGLPVKDPWGNDFVYKYGDKENYFVGSAGSDGKFDGFEQKGSYSVGNLTGQDIIFSNGDFVYAPK